MPLVNYIENDFFFFRNEFKNYLIKKLPFFFYVHFVYLKWLIRTNFTNFFHNFREGKLWLMKHYFHLVPPLGLSKPDWSPTTQPNRPMPTWFRPKSKVQSVGCEFPFSRIDRRVKWQVCFSKTWATRTRPELYKKSSQILQNQARSGEISTRFS